jgi:general secretion pathway protein C
MSTMNVARMIHRNARCLVVPPIALFAWLVASAISEALALAFAPTASELAAAPGVRIVPLRSDSHVASAAAILARNPFEHGRSPLAEPSTPASVARDTGRGLAAELTGSGVMPRCKGVSLFAIAAPSDAKNSVAVLQESPGGSPTLRGMGQAVAGKTLAFVGSRGVLLADAGALCRVSLFDRSNSPDAVAEPLRSPTAPKSMPTARDFSGGSGAHSASLNAVAPEIRRGIRQTGAHAFALDRATVEKVIEQQNDVRKIRAAPEMVGGMVVGIRLLGVQADSLLGLLGMQTGDLLESINGFDITDPVKALEAYARLLTADALTLHLKRAGQPLNLDYDIR